MRRLPSQAWLIGLVACLIIGIIGGHPLLRRTLAVQLVGHSPLYAGQGHVPFLSGSMSVWRLNGDEKRTSTLVDSDPRSETALFIENAFNRPATPSNQTTITLEDFSRGVNGKFDEMRRRYPDAKNTAWLCALRARWGLLWMRHNRLAGEITDQDWKLHRAQGVAPPEKTSWAPNFLPRDVQEALSAIACGAHVEPDNAYWNWLRAQFLLYTWRDQEAWQALEDGASKKRFDSHEHELIQGYVSAYEKALGRSLLPEEINTVRQTARDFTLPGRGMARLVAWQAIKANRRGQHKLALKIYHGFCSIQLLRVQQAYQESDAQSALSLVALVLSRERTLGNILVIDTNLANGLDADLQSLESTAAQYSTPFQKEQIKILTNRVRQLSLQQTALNPIMADGHYFEGMDASAWQRSLGAFGTGTILLQQAIVSGFLWLLLGAMLGLFLPHKKVFNVPVERSDKTIGVFLLSLIMLLMTYSALRESGRLIGGEWWPLFGLSFHASGLDEAATVVYSWGLLVPVLFCSLLAQGMTIWRATPAHPEVRKISKSASGQSDEMKTAQAHSELALAPLVGRLALFLFSAAMLFWWQNALTAPAAEWIAPRRVALVGLDLPFGGHTIHWAALHPLWPLSLAILGLLLGWTRWIFASPSHRRWLILYRLRWLHQLLGATALMAVAGYIVVSLYALPARYTAEREVRTLIERGDNALWQQRLREQIARGKSDL